MGLKNNVFCKDGKMSIFEIILMAVALAMDAFAVAICKGLATDKVKIKHMVTVGAWFGAFQALMPFIGCTIGAAFLSYIEAVDHWIAFVLLGFIGGSFAEELGASYMEFKYV